jgi:patatin-like phospholipase/acyl hydrolase
MQREKLPWPNDRPYRILSLDGGGIKGLFSAVLLTHVEEALGRKGCIGDFFDCIAGTSTGGILAIGAGLGIPAHTMRGLYERRGRAIFPPWRYRVSQTLPGKLALALLNRPLYDHTALEAALFEVLGETPLGASKPRLVIPAFLVPEAEITVFKTDHHPDFRNDHRMFAWEAARATSAAPTYLKGHERAEHMFIDGGLWANNPVMVALVDALSAYDLSRDNIEVLSIGTGNLPWQIALRKAGGGLWNWKMAVSAAMYLTSDNALAQAGLLIGPPRITRIEPQGEDALVEMDDWQGAVRRLPTAAAQAFAANRDTILQFFGGLAPPRERFYHPETL